MGAEDAHIEVRHEPGDERDLHPALQPGAPGRRVSVSGTLVTPYDYDAGEPAIDEHQRGRERFRYTLTVRRVR